MSNEYEIIDYEQLSGIKLFLVDLKHRNLHMHKEFELCLIMEGILEVYTCRTLTTHHKGSLLLLNPYQPHELRAGNDQNVLILSLQVSSRFFLRYYQTLDSLEFAIYDISTYCNDTDCKKIRDDMLALSGVYFSKTAFYELLCISYISCIFYRLLNIIPSRSISEKERFHKRTMNERLGYILSCVDDHFTEKILLSGIAKQTGLSLFYLSHWFKEHLGLPFQKYIELLRFREAKRLLEQTSMGITDISMACGFSDRRYLNHVFVKQLGCTPKDYRAKRNSSPKPAGGEGGQSAEIQRFLSAAESLTIIGETPMDDPPPPPFPGLSRPPIPRQSPGYIPLPPPPVRRSSPIYAVPEFPAYRGPDPADPHQRASPGGNASSPYRRGWDGR
jgi:AraC-like DNA-binding protein